MPDISKAYQAYKTKVYPLRFYTLGDFALEQNGSRIENKSWGRDKTLQLIQYFICVRHHHGLHKEMLIDRLWDMGLEEGDRDFKVALHGVQKVLEPERKRGVDPQFVVRQGLTYQMMTDQIWIDADAMEYLIELGHQAIEEDKSLATELFVEAVKLYKGSFLPNRMYEDWSTSERERLQIIALNAFMKLAELQIEKLPRESIRLSQSVIQIDNTWEEAYRIQMQAYLALGNRPQAIKTYKQCELLLEQEFGISPLPETTKLYNTILNYGN